MHGLTITAVRRSIFRQISIYVCPAFIIDAIGAQFTLDTFYSIWTHIISGEGIPDAISLWYISEIGFPLLQITRTTANTLIRGNAISVAHGLSGVMGQHHDSAYTRRRYGIGTNMRLLRAHSD